MFRKKEKDTETFKRHIELLGFKATDKITGLEGVIDSVCFDLYGCIQVSIKPQTVKDGKVAEGYWMDVTRVTIDTAKRVVDLPNFYEGYVAEGRKGPAEKNMRKA